MSQQNDNSGPIGARRITDHHELTRLWELGEVIVCRMKSLERGQVFEPELVRVGYRTALLRHWGGDFEIPTDSPLVEFYSCGSIKPNEWRAPKPMPSLSGWIRTDYASIWTRGLKGVELVVLKDDTANAGPWKWTVRGQFVRNAAKWDSNDWASAKDRETAEREAIEYYIRS